MKISDKDRCILRSLAGKQAEVASLPEHKEKIRMWKSLNAMKPERPMVWINEIPWHEMDVDGELALQCENEFCRSVEDQIRKTLYQWKHLRGDMVVEPVFRTSLVLRDSGFGIAENTEIEKTDEASNVVSREFIPQIQSLKDVKKIKMPEIYLDEEATERNFQALEWMFGDLLTVEKCGVGPIWFTIWDFLVRWYGVEEAMMDFVLKPELVHAAVERLLNAFMARLDRYEALNVLSLNNQNVRIGSGGLGYCDELPQSGFDPVRVRTIDQWGCSNAQIFSEVSPEMHEEFSLRYERKWLERFGMTYYGCCEPLHNKLDILKSVPNLRKISVSPWADLGKTVELAGDKYVLSHKPNPAIFADENWNPDRARKELADMLLQASGCSVEIIMKDISTVRYEPHRLWEYADIALRAAEAAGQASV